MAGTQNPKLNPISFGFPNLKSVGEKSPLHPQPLRPKSAGPRPKTAPLPSLYLTSTAKYLDWFAVHQMGPIYIYFSNHNMNILYFTSKYLSSINILSLCLACKNRE